MNLASEALNNQVCVHDTVMVTVGADQVCVHDTVMVTVGAGRGITPTRWNISCTSDYDLLFSKEFGLAPRHDRYKRFPDS